MKNDMFTIKMEKLFQKSLMKNYLFSGKVNMTKSIQRILLWV